jgi:hypothetical protein
MASPDDLLARVEELEAARGASDCSSVDVKDLEL